MNDQPTNWRTDGNGLMETDWRTNGLPDGVSIKYYWDTQRCYMTKQKSESTKWIAYHSNAGGIPLFFVAFRASSLKIKKLEQSLVNLWFSQFSNTDLSSEESFYVSYALHISHSKNKHLLEDELGPKQNWKLIRFWPMFSF